MGALMIAGMSSYAFAWYREHGRLKLEEVTEEVTRAALKLVNVGGVPFAGASSAA
jgi:hypothetical protein